MIGEIISGGLSLLGGLFGKKKQKTESSVNYVQMAKNAEAAGFNPLTALRNGGSAGFTSTVSHPGLSGVADAVSQIGGQIGLALEKKFDPIEQKRSQVESALLDYQLATIQNKPKAPMMFGDVPSKTGSAQRIQLSSPLSHKAKTAPAAAIAATSGAAVNWSDPPKPSDTDIPLWVAARDRDGKRYWIPNPDLPDLEQYPIPALARSQGGLEATASAGVKTIMDPSRYIKVRDLTAAEKKERESSWLPSWVPSFKVSW